MTLNTINFISNHTPNANMADHSVGAWDELHESEASEARCFVLTVGSLRNHDGNGNGNVAEQKN